MLLRPVLTCIRHIRYLCELSLPMSTSRFRHQRAQLLLRSRHRPNFVLQKRRLLYSTEGASRPPTRPSLYKPQLVQHSLNPDHIQHNIKPELNYGHEHRPANSLNKYLEVFKNTSYRPGSWDSHRSHAHQCSHFCRFSTSQFK
jgi:hypothetical protein